jgi:hypothetical protein
MKEVFDGFQSKPFATNLFWQSHKSILLENYKESLVKIMLPSARYQSEYDFWFINKLMAKIREYIEQHGSESLSSFEQYETVIKKA